MHNNAWGSEAEAETVLLLVTEFDLVFSCLIGPIVQCPDISRSVV